MKFALETLPDAIAAHAETWARAAMTWHTRPVSSHHGGRIPPGAIQAGWGPPSS
ncbi:hypothetical protein [Paractinoplanes abujensis]|uniref:Uncharacterized protein n=1 Tax=Paractinoplanes abujensis TaxID=882441 RepID=A0A7W7CPE1_9ACTN|nr:hypothetical protein [Actinoplanes abujensis]MBB4692295.1 hypothetical protein [Actinoplanes abujensis]